MDEKRVKIKYGPREQFRSFHNRKQRWSVLVCHRRAGKTVATLNDLIRGAVNECKPEGRYAFIFPQRNQAKDTAWRYLRRYAEPLLGKPPNETELRVDLVNGSMIRLYGADNPDALRGPYLDGVVLDEFADMKPEVWHEVVRPMLADRRGWATAQALARGSSAAAAYVEAGYKENRHNAATLARKQHILTRVSELQEEQLAIHHQATAQAAANAQVTIESLIAEAEAARAKAMEEKGGAAAAVSALIAKAKLAGMWREKVAQTDPSGENAPRYIISDRPMTEEEWIRERCGGQ
jgi:phage terminase large subunit